MADDLKSKLEAKARETGSSPPTPAQTIGAYLKKMEPEVKRVLPKHMDVDRLLRIALTTIRTNPQLLECTIPSLLGAVMQAAQLGLEPGLLGQCYIVPYGREATFIIGYKGMIDLARRSGNIKNIYAHEVYENDEFEYEYGLYPSLKHKPAMNSRGEFIGVYAVVHFTDGGYQFEFMSKEEIDKRRLRSRSYKSGPWVTDYEEMAKKTVIRHMFKYLPLSVEIMRGAAQDETVRSDITEEPVSVYSRPFEAQVVSAEDLPSESAEEEEERSGNEKEIEEGNQKQEK
ncbi:MULTISPECIES: recombination protein RecT [Aneurinibacillus]|uniref:Recombination protein RecT n=1 Tax=Aneurinibacillus thermoaerophilus TaxID=143495 RepID=A0ABX8YEF1_ANETH|nr:MULTISPECIES: recombination protein RecT [Aneurinibacillus]AMA73349.1 recombinase RecT [Aneurinibacillus sp. XH2]MED0676006.1 recombination protein RecT [Aneurinibacillus thermoaerophilus]MED0736289.1 recombination protein RecT [Aneurinibacillus thermoaerophilus]QYY44088.1 recombination protein RecT [Aneurinibacillus thermoaerophilus]